jgi:hypothetical protein
MTNPEHPILRGLSDRSNINGLDTAFDTEGVRPPPPAHPRGTHQPGRGQGVGRTRPGVLAPCVFQLRPPPRHFFRTGRPLLSNSPLSWSAGSARPIFSTQTRAVRQRSLRAEGALPRVARLAVPSRVHARKKEIHTTALAFLRLSGALLVRDTTLFVLCTTSICG